MDNFVKEIQVINSSVDKINIEINGDKANVNYLWDLDYKLNAFPDKEFNNSSVIYLKLKKNGNNWKVFDASLIL